ncbi:Nramp family divalent metal transporter [Labedaea rhizosphaerae]|uniref:Manganese transport protein n=1 Tax=Labedaea rhizosphaerae TaxID=598644 RepID=A0A4R6S680_LABRH|nr:Nramp family divalent metal transporter [Labedaea rhizosphaerae]TDP94814.1 manganese transport protein [Labedaea rhizosphaerae]
MFERNPIDDATSFLPTARIPSRVAVYGPAVVASVAYIDPGNFATNITAGARFGFTLVWVVVVANAMAVLVQYLSAKLGIATRRSLPELCRSHLPKPVSWGLWVQAELVAMATDLAEFVGAAIGLNLLFGVPPAISGLITGVVSFALLALEQRGYRRFEIAIAGLFGVVLLGFAWEVTRVGFSGATVVRGLAPGFTGADSVLLAVGIIGATVMPHVIYLHSALTKNRGRWTDEQSRRKLLRSQRVDVAVALGFAGVTNLLILILAASLLHGAGLGDADPIEFAHSRLGEVVGGSAALIFAAALLASGLSSSSVGTYAGQVVMQGFIRRRVPLVVRRGVTMLPALVVLTMGLPATQVLVISQVTLSFGIPFALVPLLWLTRKKELMGVFVNRPVTTLAASACAALIIGLNIFLIVETVG